MRRLPACFLTILALVTALGASAATDVPDSDRAAVARAKQLVDDYYGQPRRLTQAASLLQPILLRKDAPAAAYVEAARITIKGGHIVSDEFRPGSYELYGYLIERALALEPNNVRALSLKADVERRSGGDAAFLAVVKRGLAIAPNDPWLNLKLARYHLDRNEIDDGLKHLSGLTGRGVGVDSEQRRAYVDGMALLIDFYKHPENAAMMREYAVKLESARHPDDAWTLGEVGRYFIEATLFDDAIAYERRALAIMSYGVGRTNLAVALYGKAAQLAQSGGDYSAHLREARAVGVDSGRVVDWFKNSNSLVRAYVPAVARLTATN